MPDSAPAGWYADGVDPDRLRYWDGARWTDDYSAHPAASTPVLPAAPPLGRTRSRRRVLLVGLAAVLVLGLGGVGIAVLVQNLDRQAQVAAHCPVPAEDIAAILGEGAPTAVEYRDGETDSCLYEWGERWVRIAWFALDREGPTLSDDVVPAEAVALTGGFDARMDAAGRAADPSWMGTFYVRIAWDTDRHWYIDLGRGEAYDDPAEASGPADEMGAEVIAIAQRVAALGLPE